jgi:hypothetical protein
MRIKLITMTGLALPLARKRHCLGSDRRPSVRLPEPDLLAYILRIRFVKISAFARTLNQPALNDAIKRNIAAARAVNPTTLTTARYCFELTKPTRD